MKIKYSELSVIEMAKLALPIIPLEELHEEGKDGSTIYYDIEDRSAGNPCDDLIRKQIVEKVRRALKEDFDEKERLIMKYRWGLGEGGQFYTLTEMEPILNMSREAIRQREIKLKDKVKEKLEYFEL